jgi:thioredoxin reductase
VRNVIIIGSGPAGYTAAIYAARANLKPVLIASSVEAGGELMNTTEVENFPGFPQGIQGPDLMFKMQEQAERFGTEVILDDVTEVSLDGPVKTVTTGYSGTLEARSVIFATGSAYRKLGLADEERLSGRGISWCATCDGFFFKEKTIAVVGGVHAVEKRGRLHERAEVHLRLSGRVGVGILQREGLVGGRFEAFEPGCGRFGGGRSQRADGRDDAGVDADRDGPVAHPVELTCEHA